MPPEDGLVQGELKLAVSQCHRGLGHPWRELGFRAEVACGVCVEVMVLETWAEKHQPWGYLIINSSSQTPKAELM